MAGLAGLGLGALLAGGASGGVGGAASGLGRALVIMALFGGGCVLLAILLKNTQEAEQDVNKMTNMSSPLNFNPKPSD